MTVFVCVCVCGVSVCPCLCVTVSGSIVFFPFGYSRISAEPKRTCEHVHLSWLFFGGWACARMCGFAFSIFYPEEEQTLFSEYTTIPAVCTLNIA